MLEYLKKKYFEIVASLIDPIVGRALALSWVMRLAIVLIPLGLWGGWEYREQLKNHLALELVGRTSVALSDECLRWNVRCDVDERCARRP